MVRFLGARSIFAPDRVCTVILFALIFVIVPLSAWKRFGLLMRTLSPMPNSLVSAMRVMLASMALVLVPLSAASVVVSVLLALSRRISSSVV
jgi:hypothetical protein